MKLQEDVDAALQGGEALAPGLPGAAWQGEAALRFAPGLPVFAGHFPQGAIVPGVYLVAAVAVLAQRLMARSGTLVGVGYAKWSRPAAPGSPLIVRASGRWAAASGPEAAIAGTVSGPDGPCLRCAIRIAWP
jgi:hypothetical protein